MEAPLLNNTHHFDMGFRVLDVLPVVDKLEAAYRPTSIAEAGLVQGCRYIYYLFVRRGNGLERFVWDGLALRGRRYLRGRGKCGFLFGSLRSFLNLYGRGRKDIALVHEQESER